MEATKFTPAQPWLASSESDPNGFSSKQPGAKLDAGKAPVFQGVLSYFPRALIALSSLSGYGANKYAWKGWESVPDGENRYANAAGRHLLKEAIEGEWDLDAANDPKFPGDILHATQVAWNDMARLELMLRRKDSEKARGSGYMAPVRPDLYSHHTNDTKEIQEQIEHYEQRRSK